MKRKILKFIAGIVLIVFLFFYIPGQAGALECDLISVSQYFVRTSIALAILAADALLINYLGKGENP